MDLLINTGMGGYLLLALDSELDLILVMYSCWLQMFCSAGFTESKTVNQQQAKIMVDDDPLF